ASPEPRLGGRGNLYDPCLAELIPLLQWSHGSEAVETRKAPGKQSRRKRLQWSHGSEAVETWTSGPSRTRSSASFNGATARRPWKRVGRMRLFDRELASMEPRLGGRGNSVAGHLVVEALLLLQW